MQQVISDRRLLTVCRSVLRLLPTLALLSFTTVEGLAQDEMTLGASDRLAMNLVVYEDDLALVREQRLGGLRKGINNIAFADISAQLRPATVILSGVGLRMLEQRFAFDTITPRRLLEAAVGKQVRLITTHPQTGLENIREATLLGMSEGPVLQLGERIEIAPPGRIVLSEMPEGLRQGATLLAKVEAQAEGSGELGLTYLTRGLSWRADYIAHVDPKGDSLTLSTLVTLTNTSGGDYPDSEVSLVAGQVNQTRADVVQQRGVSAKMMAQAVPEALEDVAPRSVADRHVYKLPQRVSLPNRQTVQVSLFQAADVKVKREYRFENLVQAYPGSDEIGPVNASLQLRLNNDEENGLGSAATSRHPPGLSKRRARRPVFYRRGLGGPHAGRRGSAGLLGPGLRRDRPGQAHRL